MVLHTVLVARQGSEIGQISLLHLLCAAPMRDRSQVLRQSAAATSSRYRWGGAVRKLDEQRGWFGWVPQSSSDWRVRLAQGLVVRPCPRANFEEPSRTVVRRAQAQPRTTL